MPDSRCRPKGVAWVGGPLWVPQNVLLAARTPPPLAARLRPLTRKHSPESAPRGVRREAARCVHGHPGPRIADPVALLVGLLLGGPRRPSQRKVGLQMEGPRRPWLQLPPFELVVERTS